MSATDASAQDASVIVVESSSTTLDSGAQFVTPPGTTPSVYVEVPLAEDESGFADRVAGFSRDDRYLGYEISTCDPCPSQFLFTGGPGVPAIDLSYFYDPTIDDEHVAEVKRTKHDALVDKQLAALGVGKARDGRKLRGPFPYADLVFATKPARDVATGRVSLLFGAHLPHEPPIFPIRLDLGAHPSLESSKRDIESLPPTNPDRATMMKELLTSLEMDDPVLAYANVTKDGREIGAVAIARGSMWYESGATSRMPTSAFVGQIYNDSAMRHLKAHEDKLAADGFEKAEAARPESELFTYNLACATARLRDPRAEGALTRAITKGGAATKERAKKDADFNNVRKEAWFEKLTQ